MGTSSLLDAITRVEPRDLQKTNLGAYPQRTEKTKGPRAATRIAAPWRQGTETGSIYILTGTVFSVNSQRQLGSL